MAFVRLLEEILTLQLTEHEGISFYIDDSLFTYDSYEHWLHLVAWAIKKVSSVLGAEATEPEMKQWVVFHRTYNRSNKLDFNYARFSSLNASFEAIRDLDEYGYSDPKIVNVIQQQA